MFVQFAAVSDTQVFLFSMLTLLLFLVLVAIAVVSWLMQEERNGPSPYTERPLLSGTRLPMYSTILVERYLRSLKQYENRPFNMRKAAICRETGRIFQDCKVLPWKYAVDWSFIQKRFPGHYVSWGSLTQDQQRDVRLAHEGRLGGFETDYSCPNPLPKDIEPSYSFYDLGPLYVDIETKVLIGWKKVPETELEVLIVQKPVKVTTISIPKHLKPEKQS